MEKIILVFALSLSFFIGYSQIDTNLIYPKEKSILPDSITNIYDYQFRILIRKPDTIKVKMLISETIADTILPHTSHYKNNDTLVFKDNKLKVINGYYTSDIEDTYLDEFKNKLPKNIIVWQIKKED